MIGWPHIVTFAAQINIREICVDLSDFDLTKHENRLRQHIRKTQRRQKHSSQRADRRKAGYCLVQSANNKASDKRDIDGE